MTPDELKAIRGERARRWLHTDLKGYPTVLPEEETEETLAASPPEKAEKKPRPPLEGGR